MPPNKHSNQSRERRSSPPAMTTVFTAKIDESGTQFAYLDSGPPSSDMYTTLIVVHGLTYHAQNFARLLPIAQNHNLRVIALNRRDYVGSTPFSPTELEAISGGDDEAHLAFLQARGLEIARFLVWVIQEKKIPPASADGKEGGLALMGWSLGNATTMAFLRHLKLYPSEVVEAIGPYLKTFYIYDCGSGIMGYPSPEGFQAPSITSIPARMRGVYLGTVMSSYYKHPYYSAAEKPDRVISSLLVRMPEGEQVYRPCTLDKLTPAELIACVDPAPAARSEYPFLRTVGHDILYDQTQGSLLLGYTSPITKDPEARNDQGAKGNYLLPDIKICVMYGYASLWNTIWGVWELEKDYEKWKAEGRKPRRLHFLPVEGANHFLHCDDSELFLKVVTDGIGQ